MNIPLIFKTERKVNIGRIVKSPLGMELTNKALFLNVAPNPHKEKRGNHAGNFYGRAIRGALGGFGTDKNGRVMAPGWRVRWNVNQKRNVHAFAARHHNRVRRNSYPICQGCGQTLFRFEARFEFAVTGLIRNLKINRRGVNSQVVWVHVHYFY